MKHRTWIPLLTALALAAVVWVWAHAQSSQAATVPAHTGAPAPVIVQPSPEPIKASGGATETTGPREYWLVLEQASGGATPLVQISSMMEHLFPYLAEQQQQGQLDSFAPAPALGAIRLISPRPALLARVRTWPGVVAVVPVADRAALAPFEATRLAAHRLDHLDVATVPAAASLAARAPSGVTGAGGLNDCTLYEAENIAEGQVITPSLNLTVTLREGGLVKSRVPTLADSNGDWRVYFTDTIRGGDVVEVLLPGQTPLLINVPSLSVAPDKASDVVDGLAPANDVVDVEVYSISEEQTYYANAVSTDGSGRFSADFSSQVDFFIGDAVSLIYTDADGFRIVLRGQSVPGLRVNVAYDGLTGYATPGVTVTLVLKDDTGQVKATDSVPASRSGYFYTLFASQDPCAPDVEIVVGDRVEMGYSGQPTVTVEVVGVTVDTIDPATDVITGTAPAGSKIGVNATDAYRGDRVYQVVNASTAGEYRVDLTGVLDLVLGSQAFAFYYDAQDNEVGGANLYVGPYARVNLNHSMDLEVAGRPAEPVTATLRNAFGAIKATAGGIAGSNGYLSVYFLDNAGGSVDPVPGDRVEVDFGSGITRTVDVVGVDYIIDRNARAIYGTGPANAELRLVHAWNNDALVTLDASGYFSHTFDWLTGGNSAQVIYRDARGNDVYNHGCVPQFVVYPDSNSVSGCGPARKAVVVTLKDPGGATKAKTDATTQDNGYYWLDFHGADVAFGDTVVVDVGPLHYEQEVVTLTIAADVVNDVVYGTAPADGRLNLWANRNFGPYNASYSDYLHADYTGNFATTFGTGTDLRGGDKVTVQYWGPHDDRVRIHRYTPYVRIRPKADSVGGYTTPGATGTVTVRDGGGVLKASGTVTGHHTWGYFDFTSPGLDLVPGDQVAVQVAVLDQTVPVIPMSGTLDLQADTLSGVGPANDNIGLSIYHWDANSGHYSVWVDGKAVNQFAETDASGAFDLDLQCMADLAPGDYLGMFYIDNLDTHYDAYFYTTQPTVTVDSYPTSAQPGMPVEVRFTLAQAAHPYSAIVRWDTVSHADDNAYRHWDGLPRGSVGQNVVSFNAPTGGTIYFKVLVYVDGQSVWSADEYTIAVESELAASLVEPVSGTTNDPTPQIQGVTAPDASVTLYEGATALMTTTADADGRFTFDVTSPLSTGDHDLHATATLSDVLGPNSNLLHLTVSPTLKVDPVHILIRSHGTAQHLRDEDGYANLGGRIWTRAGDMAAVAIPIRCTELYTADLYVGGVLATPLLNVGNDVYVGAYTPPGSGTYAADVKFRCGGSAGMDYTINLLTGLIDPDGYVYDASKGLDHHLAGATVTCYELVDEGNDTWQVWNAALWDQVNPQTTGAAGYYSFFTLPGKYKIHVTAPGYKDYKSPVLTVEDKPVHHNVGLQSDRLIYLPLVLRN